MQTDPLQQNLLEAESPVQPLLQSDSEVWPRSQMETSEEDMTVPYLSGRNDSMSDSCFCSPLFHLEEPLRVFPEVAQGKSERETTPTVSLREAEYVVSAEEETSTAAADIYLHQRLIHATDHADVTLRNTKKRGKTS